MFLSYLNEKLFICIFLAEFQKNLVSLSSLLCLIQFKLKEKFLQIYLYCYNLIILLTLWTLELDHRSLIGKLSPLSNFSTSLMILI